MEQDQRRTYPSGQVPHRWSTVTNRSRSTPSLARSSSQFGPDAEGQAVPLRQATPYAVPLAGCDRVGGTLADHRQRAQMALASASRACRAGPGSPWGEKKTALSTFRHAARNRHDQNGHTPGSTKGSRQTVIARWIPEQAGARARLGASIPGRQEAAGPAFANPEQVVRNHQLQPGALTGPATAAQTHIVVWWHW